MKSLDPSFCQLIEGDGPLLATAIHDGSGLRTEVGERIALSETERLREEDPHTGAWTTLAPTRLVVLRSRFEVDLNRPREKCVYRRPEDAWGLKVWAEEPPAALFERSLDSYDAFYEGVEKIHRGLAERFGKFVVFDLHSYNHRRDGPGSPPSDPAANPEVNVGTGTLKERERWAPLIDRFIADLSGFDLLGRHLDVRENVRFRGGNLGRWTHESFPEAGCVLSVEFKKFFMDEWTGQLDTEQHTAIGRALAATVPGVLEELERLGVKSSASKTRAATAPSASKKRAVAAPSASEGRAAAAPVALGADGAGERRTGNGQRRTTMRLGMVVNDVMSEKVGYTTTRLGQVAVNRGHEVFVMGVSDFAYDADENIRARARRVIKAQYKTPEAYLNDLQGKGGRSERITVDDLDILMLRNDPSEDKSNRTWAQTAGIDFGRIAMRHGVIVLNDPNALAKAANKMYFQLFPEEVRPKTLITLDRDEIKAFIKDLGGHAVLKPLQGSGGSGVFLVRPEDRSNTNQMIEALVRDGYVIAQEYLPAAEQGDTRLFLMNGEPLRYKGKYAAFRRVRRGDDMRSNIHAGGTLAAAEIGPAQLHLAEIVRPKLTQDGMFLVGLDIVGDKLMEINVFSPGGLGSAQKLEKVNFSIAVVEALERKVAYMGFYRRNFENVEMATL